MFTLFSSPEAESIAKTAPIQNLLASLQHSDPGQVSAFEVYNMCTGGSKEDWTKVSRSQRTSRWDPVARYINDQRHIALTRRKGPAARKRRPLQLQPSSSAATHSAPPRYISYPPPLPTPTPNLSYNSAPSSYSSGMDWQYSQPHYASPIYGNYDAYGTLLSRSSDAAPMPPLQYQNSPYMGTVQNQSYNSGNFPNDINEIFQFDEEEQWDGMR